ncbi:MAG: extracellular solute-binding protein [bacterium]|nr:extracellular solute-binding protein [bacterium]
MRKIRFWSIINEQHSGMRSIDQELKIFRKETGIIVELTEFPWRTVWDNIINSIKEENKPDVLQIGNSWTSILSQIGYLEDITQLFQYKDHINDIYNISPEIDKRYYSMPWLLDLSLLFIRKNSDTKGCRLDTVNDLLSLCRSQKESKLFSFGGNKDPILIQYLSSFIWSAGGDYIQGNGIDLATAENYTGIRNFFNLAQKYSLKHELLNIYGDVIWDFFLKGKGLFTFANAWVINSFIKPYRNENKFMAVVLPGTGKARYPFKGGSCLGIVKGTPVLKESIEFIRFLTGPDSQKRYLTRIGALPVRKDVLHKVIDEFLYRDAILHTLRTARTFPARPYWGSCEKILLEFINDIFIDIVDNRYSEKNLRKKVKELNPFIRTVIDLWGR